MGMINTALSGIRVSSARLDASAANIAHAGSTGPVPSAQRSSSQTANLPVLYQPVQAQSVELSGGGAISRTVPIRPSYRLIPDPASRYADIAGMIATPNIKLVDELTEQLSAKFAYDANLSIIRTVDRLESRLFEAWA